MTPDQSRPKNNPKSASAVSGPPRVNLDPKLMKILETKFKLTIPEARAYTSLLVFGQLTNDQLSLYSEVPIDSINSIVEALLKKQLIKRISGVVNRYRAFAPFKELAKMIKQFEVDSDKFQKDLSNLKLPKFQGNKNMDRVFKFYEEITKLLKDSILVKVFPDWGTGLASFMIPLRGHEQFLIDSIQDKKFFHEMIDFSFESRKKCNLFKLIKFFHQKRAFAGHTTSFSQVQGKNKRKRIKKL